MPLDKDSPYYLHLLQNISLFALSLIFLPIDTIILLWSLILRPSLAPHASREALSKAQNSPTYKRRTILVTGVGMTKGLALARAFHLAGHRVIGADFEAHGALVCGRVSRSLNAFYPMQKPTATSSAGYVSSLLSIIQREHVELWVSCSGVASAVSDGEAKEAVEAQTACRAIQYDVATTSMLHEKHYFIERTQALGLTVPETHVVTSRAQLRDIFADAKVKGIQYILKTVAMDDANRGNMTLLPFASDAETEKYTTRINASEANPWIAQQFISGREYCTHALVIRGQVKVFVASPSLELLMHYVALPSESPLSLAMLAFTRTFAAAHGETFTGHLSFDFLVESESERAMDPKHITLYPIECNPRAHTAVALFNDTPEMVGAYLSLLDRRRTGLGAGEMVSETPIVPRAPKKYHWMGHDLVAFCIMPVLAALRPFVTSTTDSNGNGTTNKINTIASPESMGTDPKPQSITAGLSLFADYAMTWKDGTYEVWDPLPWWWLYHVYWPMQFAYAAVAGVRWSRVNVSTTKMFLC